MKPILMIVTSHDKLGNTGKSTGIWAEELTTPYFVLRDAGHAIVLASVLGGRPPFAGTSLHARMEDNEPTVKRFLLDQEAMTQFNQTVRTADLDSGDYCAVFLPGGHGPMWDTATDPHTARLVGEAFNAGRPVAAVCHGPAGLVLARRSDGQSILHGKRVNSFTDEEETAIELMDVVPFHLETRLKELGGEFVRGPMWKPFAVRDGHLITGQNPASSTLVAQHLIEALQ
jgi:putative intracellular protease/amidase